MAAKLPAGQRYLLAEASDDKTFYFDCRSVPRPRPNLVFIHRGVCNRSGYLPTFQRDDLVEPGCPILACPYNTRDDDLIQRTASDYKLLPVANLRPGSQYPVVDDDDEALEVKPDTILCVKCEPSGLEFFDEEPDPQLPGTFRRLSRCPECGTALPQRKKGESSRGNDHIETALRFGPPLSSFNAAGISLEENPDVEEDSTEKELGPGVDLSEEDLSERELTNLDLTEANLKGADLSGARLTDVNLTNATLVEACLMEAELVLTLMEGSDLRFALLDEAKAPSCMLRGSDARRASFKGADLSGGQLSEANLAGSDFSGANLEGAVLEKASLAGAKLCRANLTGANLTKANLAEADLTGAIITGACLSGVTAPNAIFSEANLEAADATGADLSNCNFTGATLSGARFDKASLYAANLTKVKAQQASFEFADLRESQIVQANLAFSSLRGADLRGARARETDLQGVDLIWAQTDSFEITACNTTGLRLPDSVPPAYGPKGSTPPSVEPKPLYRPPATAEERERLLQSLRDAAADL